MTVGLSLADRGLGSEVTVVAASMFEIYAFAESLTLIPGMQISTARCQR